MYAIKGFRAISGFESTSFITYEVETVRDLAQNDSIPIDKEIIDQPLAARDRTRLFLLYGEIKQNADQSKSHTNAAFLQKLIQYPHSLVKGDSLTNSAVVASSKPNQVGTDIAGWIHFKPFENIAFRGMDPDDLINERCSQSGSTATAWNVPTALIAAFRRL